MPTIANKKFHGEFTCGDPALVPPPPRPRPTVTVLRNERVPDSDPLAYQQRERRRQLLREYRQLVVSFAADETVADVDRLAYLESVLKIDPSVFARAVELHREMQRDNDSLGDVLGWRKRSEQLASETERLAKAIQVAEDSLRKLRAQRNALVAERRCHMESEQHASDRRRRGWLLVGDEDETLGQLDDINRNRSRVEPRGVKLITN